MKKRDLVTLVDAEFVEANGDFTRRELDILASVNVAGGTIDETGE